MPPHILRRSWFRRVLVILSVAVFAVSLVWTVARLGDPPETQQEAEAHLDRSVLFYDVWEGVPYVVVEFGGSVRFDRLILDWISVEWPPTPRWQWTGFWSTIDTTTNPASVAVSGALGEQVIYGQINSQEIVWLGLRVDGEWHRHPVSYPGFAIWLPADQQSPTEYRWLDAEGRVIWSEGGDGARSLGSSACSVGLHVRCSPG